MRSINVHVLYIHNETQTNRCRCTVTDQSINQLGTYIHTYTHRASVPHRIFTYQVTSFLASSSGEGRGGGMGERRTTDFPLAGYCLYLSYQPRPGAF